MEYCLNKLENSNIITEPWDHLIIKDFLPADFYINLISELDTTPQQHRLEKNIAKQLPAGQLPAEQLPAGPATLRTHVVSSKYDIQPKKQYIKNYFNMLQQPDIRTSIISKFDISMRKIQNNYNNVGNIQQGCYDISTIGHKYRVHRDSQNKLVTMILYLAEEGDDITLGTRIYPPVRDIRSLDWEKDCVKIIPYMPNCLVIFPSNKHTNKCTNHAMGHASKKTKFRKTLVTFYPHIR